MAIFEAGGGFSAAPDYLGGHLYFPLDMYFLNEHQHIADPGSIAALLQGGHWARFFPTQSANSALAVCLLGLHSDFACFFIHPQSIYGQFENSA